MRQDLNKTLYRPAFEHDACGIGFVARTTGVAGHDILSLALSAITCMEHRAGVDADGLSGDGAGILTQLPHRLLAAEIEALPEPGDYALGMLPMISFRPPLFPIRPMATTITVSQKAMDRPREPGVRPSRQIGPVSQPRPPRQRFKGARPGRLNGHSRTG
jgi:hypothetical protein